ncbi:MAG: hypothetical protein AB7F50_11025 [Fimbriimonadaceae bacterium]
MARKLVFLALVLFLLAFPALGLLWIWSDGHSKVRLSAIAEANRVMPELLAATDLATLDSYGTLEFRQSRQAAAFVEARLKMGRPVSSGSARAVGSKSGSKNDRVWHFVDLVTDVRFDSGAAKVRLKLARETMAPDWRIEDIVISQNP